MRGAHDEEINMYTSQREGEKRRRKKKKNFDFISNTGSNLAALFIQNYVSKQLPYAGHKLGFAVAGCLNR